MAIKLDNSTLFKAAAAAGVLCLLLAAALVYLQAGDDNTSTAQLAALSQAIPMQASRALQGEADAFDELGRSVRTLTSLRRDGAPGQSSDWQQLQANASEILERRVDVTAAQSAAATLAEDAGAILSLSDALFERSGSTAIIQEFQQRAERIRQTATMMPRLPAASAGQVVDDVAFLRNVTDALFGNESNLDVRPMPDADREAALPPIIEKLQGLERAAAEFAANFPQTQAMLKAQEVLQQNSAGIMDAGFGGSGRSSSLPTLLRSPWIPVGLIALGLLVIGVLTALHAKTSLFEKAAREQTDRNERNQQAILRLLDEMGSLADGDLTVEATVTEDITGTIADSFNFAIEELRKLVATVNDTALLVDTAAKQTENTAAHLAKAAENQASEISAATESIVSMAASIEEVSGNAERSSDVARHSVEVAHKGGEAVRRTIDGMNAIRETIQETSKRIKRLGESSQEIGNIVELINDIAEQTNILALNASIQASMAGEAGRGFAVVADEVQRLAERSTNATRQIEVLVRTIQSDTNEAVVSMERSTTDVVGGALLAENAGAALDEIEQVSNQIASLVQNISSSAREQAGSAADVTKRTTRLREIGNQTGQATKATAASIAKLSELATQLRKTVDGFTLPAEMMQPNVLARATTANPPPVAQPNPRAQTG